VESAGPRENNEVKIFLDAEPQRDLRPAISRAVVEKGWDLLELTPIDVSLEDVFIDLVTEEGQEGEANSQSSTKEAA